MQTIEAGVPVEAALTVGDAETDMRRQRMSVHAGEFGLLIPWGSAREVTPTPPVSRLPNTAAWLRGLANVRGSLVPVVDAALAFGDVRRRRADFLLICGHGDESLGLLIDGLPRAFDIGETTPYSEAAPLPAALEASVLALYRHDERIWIDLDLTSLFDLLAHDVAVA